MVSGPKIVGVSSVLQRVLAPARCISGAEVWVCCWAWRCEHDKMMTKWWKLIKKMIERCWNVTNPVVLRCFPMSCCPYSLKMLKVQLPVFFWVRNLWVLHIWYCQPALLVTRFDPLLPGTASALLRCQKRQSKLSQVWEFARLSWDPSVSLFPRVKVCKTPWCF